MESMPKYLNVKWLNEDEAKAHKQPKMTPDDPEFRKQVAFFDKDPEDVHFFRRFFTRKESLLFLPTYNYATQHYQRKNDKAMGLDGGLRWPQLVDHDYPLMALRAALLYYGIRAPGSKLPKPRMRSTYNLERKKVEQKYHNPDDVFGSKNRYKTVPETYRLHGFQGNVIFDTKSEDSFTSAVQRLLSLPSGTGSPYILLQHHADNTLQSRYRFNLPKDPSDHSAEAPKGSGGSEGSSEGAYKAIQKILLNTRGQLFIKTLEDKDPTGLDPEEQQFTNDRGDICYVPWPAIDHHVSARSFDLIAWRACLETAFNVLVGEEDRIRFQCLLAKVEMPRRYTTSILEHACVMFRPSFLKVLNETPSWNIKKPPPSTFHWKHWGNGTAKGNLVLPGYHPSGKQAIEMTLDGTPQDLYEKAQNAVYEAFGPYSKYVDRFRLICATNVLDNFSAHPDDLSEYDLEFSMRVWIDDYRPGPKALERMMKRCQEDGLPIFVHPVWRDLPASSSGPIIATFVTNNVKTYRMTLPGPGKSTIQDLWHTAFKLRASSKGWNDVEEKTPDKRDTCIKITPVLVFYGSSREHRAHPDLELESVFITPDMNNHDWFGIRARLTTQLYDVCLISREDVLSVGPFNDARARTVEFGPRYGPAYKHRQMAKNPETRRIDAGAMAFFNESSESNWSSASSDSSSDDDESPVRKDKEEPTSKEDAQPEAKKAPARSASGWEAASAPRNTLGTSPSLPKISKAIMTPTEQATLQQAHGELRRVHFTGTGKCPIKNCQYTFQQPDILSLDHHLQTVHVRDKCPWCDNMAYATWDHDQRMKHISKKHRDILCDLAGVTDLAHALPGMDQAQASRPGEPATGEKRPRKTAGNDTSYRYSSDNDSADGLQPDVDDLAPKKRRRVDDPAFRPSQSKEVASDEEPLKAKKSAKAKAAATLKKSSPKKATPKKATPTGKAPITPVTETKTTPKQTTKATVTPKKKVNKAPVTPATPAAAKPSPGTPATTRVTRAAARAARGGN